MTFEIAKRRALPVFLSLAGKSGSGKTYSALLLAKGLVGETGKICVIDTERGRASIYADDPRIGPYYAKELHPPFSPEAFVKKLGEAREFGADCIIIDSVSHEWSGIGGVLEQVDKLIEARGQAYRMPAWGKLKPAHNAFINHLANMTCHVITCVRAKKKLVEQVGPNGKKEWVELPDLVAEQQENFVFETLAAALIDDDHNAKWTKVPEPLKGVLVPGVINKAQGEAIRKWVGGGESYNKEIAGHLAQLRQIAGSEGVEGMRKYWADTVKKAPKGVQNGLLPHLPEIQEMAERAEAIKANQSDEKAPRELPDDPFADQFTKKAETEAA